MSHPYGLRAQFPFSHLSHTPECRQRKLEAWWIGLRGSTGECVTQKLEVLEQVRRSETWSMVLRDDLWPEIYELPTARRAAATRFNNK